MVNYVVKLVRSLQRLVFIPIIRGQISRPENMDVYLQKEVQTVTWEEIIEGKLHNAILIVPIREMDTLRKVIIEKQSYVSGNYGIVIL